MRLPCGYFVILFLWCPLRTSERSPIDYSPLTAMQHGELVLFWAYRITEQTILPIKPSAIRWRVAGSDNETSAPNCATPYVVTFAIQYSVHVVPPPSGAARPRTAPQTETPKTPK